MANQGNRVYVSTATVGTGTITLGAAVTTAFTTFAEAGIADGTVIRSYCIEDGTNFEIGSGTYTAAGTTLTRTTVFLSKIAGVSGTTKITLSGSAKVRVIAAAEDIVTTTGNNALAGDLTWTGAAWTVWTPTVGANTGTLTAASGTGRYEQNGKTVFFSLSFSITTNGTAGGYLTFTLPVTSAGSAYSFYGREMSLTGKMVVGYPQSTTVVSFRYYDNTYPGADATNFYISGTYEAA